MLLTWFIIFAHLAGASVRAIMEVRTAQGTIAWVFALNTVPYVSVPAYWILGGESFEATHWHGRKTLSERTRSRIGILPS
jgi:hypothetical protein